MKKLPHIICCFQVLALAFFGIFALQLPQDNSIDSFAVKEETSQKNYDTLMKEFPNTETFLITIESQKGISQEKFLQNAEKICLFIADDPTISQYRTWLSDVPVKLRYQLLKEAPDKIAEELTFPFFSEGFYTGVFELNPVTPEQREQLVQGVLEKVEFMESQHSATIKNITPYGEPVVNYYLGLNSVDIKEIFFPLLLALSVFLLGIIFKSGKVLFITFVSVISSLATTMGLFALFGNTLNLVTNLIPLIIFVLAVAMQMHILLSFFNHVNILVALKEKLVPNLLVTLTTSIGFGSLVTSQVGPIALMGKYMAVGMWVIFFWSYVTHLGVSQIIQLQSIEKKSKIFDLAPKFAGFSKHPAWALIPVFTFAFSFFIIKDNPLESNGIKYFPEKHPVRQQTENMEKNITGASSIELLVATNGKPKIEFEFYNQVKAIENDLSSLPNIRHIISLNSQFLLAQKSLAGFDSYDEEDLKFPSQEDFEMFRKEIYASASDLIKNVMSAKFYRIQILCNSVGSDEAEALKLGIEKICQKHTKNLEIVISGPLIRITETQSYLLSSLSMSLGLTFILVLILMALFLKNMEVMYLSIIPNLFPLSCMGLFLWILSIPTTISTVMVFSIAFGIAVDSTIHLFHSFYTAQEYQFTEKWNHSIQMNSIAILLTTITLAGGFAVIALSSFLPTQHFGVLLMIGMVSAFIGDIFLLPVVLEMRYKQ